MRPSRRPPIDLRPIHVVLGTASALAIDYAAGFAISGAGQQVDPGQPQLALVEMGLLILSIGLSLLAGYLLKKNLKNPLQDERPTQLATRGSYIAWFSGIRRVGYCLTWAGDRGQRKEEGAGKGDLFSGPSQTVFVESGMHMVCVGPVDALLSIEQGGKSIFTGPITSLSHPSGTLIDLGGEGAFRIFWGEDDQPVNTYLGPGRTGISSRWPNFCYVEWRAKRLGTSPNWPLMSYTLLKKPTGNHLSNSERYRDPSRTLTGQVFSDFSAVSAALGYIELDKDSLGSGTSSGDFSADFRPLDIVRLEDNALPDQDLTVLNVTVIPVTQGTPPFLEVVSFKTRIFVEEDLTGIDLNGTLQPYIEEEDDGANAAHAIADMLFEKWPQGASLSKTFWDINSLEAMGTLLETEDLRTSWVAQEARTVEERLGAGLQDLGFMLPIDSATGLLKFQPLREPTGTLANLDNKMLVDNLPELEKFMGIKPVDFMIFGFPDRALNFRDMTVGRTEDGQISFLEVARARPVAITCTTFFDTAAVIANRRTQEEMAQGSVWNLKTNRATREWLPGQAITADFTTEVLRVLEVEPTPDSNLVNLKVFLDSYGIQASTFVDTAPPPATGVTPAQQDIAFALIEVPEYIDDVPPQTVLIPRIRAHSQIDSALLHLSANGSTFTQVSQTAIHNPGGRLTTALSSSGLFEPANGTVQFTTLGPDIGNVLDLTGDDASWRSGRQLVVIASSAGVEIGFLKKVAVVSGSTYSLDGLIRARYDTRRLAHPVGGQLFIVDRNDLTAIQNLLLAPQVTRYCKTQPQGNGIVSLADVPALSAGLYGKGVRPPPIAGLRVTAPTQSPSYSTGDDVTVKWDYPTPRTPGTGAGFNNAGVAVGQTSPEGPFLLEILTIADVVKRTESLTNPTYTYDNADLVSDLGSEVSFKVRVTQLRDGYVSDTVTLTVEKV